MTLLFALILSVTFCIPSEREREREGGMEGARERESRLEGKPWRQTLYMHASRHPAPAADFLIGLFPHVWSSSPTCCPPPHHPWLRRVKTCNLISPTWHHVVVNKTKPSPPASDTWSLISAPLSLSPASPQIDPKVAFPRRAQPKVSCTEGVNVAEAVLMMSPCHTSSLRPLIGRRFRRQRATGGDQRQSTCPS